MIASILRKELYKTRSAALAVAGANLLLVGHLWVITSGLFRKEHAEMVWYQAMQLGLPFYDTLRYAPLCTGAVLALLQFVPEMKNERLRLALHLPIDTAACIAVHLLAGLAALAFCLLIQGLGIFLVLQLWFPVEMLAHVMSVWTPWALAGAVGYLGGAFVLLEPNFPRRMANLALAAGLAGLPFWPSVKASGGLAPEWMLLPLALLAVAVLHPAFRYRHRRVD